MTAFRDDEIHAGVFAERQPDKPAIIMAGDGRVITFADFEARSNQTAHLMRRCGLVRGDGVVILMENNAEYLSLAWGVLRCGLRLSAIATHLTTDEIDYILDDSGAKVLVTSKAMLEKVSTLQSTGVPASSRFMADGEFEGFSSLEVALESQPRTPITDQSEGIEMLYSSGTTGRPKAVKKILPEIPFGLPSPPYQAFARLHGIDENTIYLHPAPLYHAAPLMGHLRVIRYGGTCVIVGRFDAERSLQLIEQYKVTHSQWVPTHFVRLLRLPSEVRSSYDLSSHKTAIHAAAPCPIEVKRQMIDWWGPMIREYYGGSEGNGYVTANSAEWLARPGTVGRATLGTIRICDDNGEEVPVGHEGTVFFEDGPVFEYLNDPEKTAASRNHRGWSTLGDVGYVERVCENVARRS